MNFMWLVLVLKPFWWLWVRFHFTILGTPHIGLVNQQDHHHEAILVGGLEHEIYDFPFSWECHHPNWRTHIFQRGGSTTNQILMGIFHGNIVRYFVEFQGITFIMEIFFCGGFLWGHPQIICFFLKYCRTIINYKPSSTMGMFIYNSNNNGNRMQIYGRIRWISLI